MLYYLLRPFLWVTLRIAFWLAGGIRAEGRENVPPAGALIVCPNHVSFADPPAVGTTLRRYAWFMATDEMFTVPVIGLLGRLMRAFPIRQDSPDRAALRRTIDLLRRGQAVVVFPEGHVSRNGQMQPVQAGVILLAVQTGAPVLPVGILNTERVMPPHTWRLRRAGVPVVVRYGAPIPVAELTGGLKGRAGLERGAETLGRAIAGLTGQAPPPPREADGEPDRESGDQRGAADFTRVRKTPRRERRHAGAPVR